MADVDESLSQRQARLRREKREAKIKATGQDRLDRITALSGRTPESMRNYESPVATPPRTESPALPPTPTPADTSDPEQLRQQEDFLRAMLRSQSVPQGQQQQQPGTGMGDQEDPMMKMLAQMMGGMNGDSNAPEGVLPSLNPEDLAKATGLPPFVMNMMMGNQDAPATAAEIKSARIWNVLHVLVTFMIGIYMLFTVDKSTSMFGENPPAPATIQNPFVIFITTQSLLHGLKPFISARPTKGGPMVWWQTAKEVGRDAAIMVFLMGAYSWWHDLA